jgi:curved DNA-binding protein CbpA
MTLYDILKVKPSATPAQIALAYRKRALETHPDRSGSRVAFEEARKAYAVLGDAQKRAIYDETGHIPDDAPDASMACLSGVFMAVIHEVIKHEASVKDCDVVASMRKQLQVNIDGLIKQRNELKEMADVVKEAAKRFVAPGESNVLAELALGHVRGIEAGIVECDNKAAVNRKALEMLKDFRFDFDKTELSWDRASWDRASTKAWR